MDFGALPPEINSGRMYAGPRSGPMLAAAAAWDGLAAELDLATASYGSVISELTSASWLGPASASMAAAAAPYLAWMSTAAAQAEQTATQAKAAAGAYEVAFAMTVPPPVIAANRSLLMSLVATNILGQNAPAIAATEAHYAEMWAQDAAAMYAYAGASAAASTVMPFTSPQQTTNPDGPAGQAVALTQAGSTLAQAMTSTSPQLITASTVPHALQSLASTPSASSALGLQGFLGPLSTANLTTLGRGVGNTYFSMGILQSFVSIAQQLVPGTPSGAGAAGSATLFDDLAGLGGVGPASASASISMSVTAAAKVSVSAAAKVSASAGLGKAGLIGGMSVPPSWAADGSAVKLAAAELPITSVNAVPAGGPAGLLRGIPLTGTARRAGGFVHRYGFRHTVIPRPSIAG